MFERLDPSKMADALQHSMRDAVLGGMLPLSVVHYLLEKVAKAIIKDIEQIVSIKDIVVSGLTTDAGVLGAFFQEVGREELKYLINSGYKLMSFQSCSPVIFLFQHTLWLCVGCSTNATTYDLSCVLDATY